MNYLAMALTAKKRREVQDDPRGLIDRTLREISEAWEPGTLERMKRSRPDDWKSVIALEAGINEKVLTGDIGGLRKPLEEYRGLMLAMVKTLSSKGEQATLFNTQKK